MPMGYVLDIAVRNKAEALTDHYYGSMVKYPVYADIPEDRALVAVFRLQGEEQAVLIDSEEEFNCMLDNPLPHKYVVLPRNIAHNLAGYHPA